MKTKLILCAAILCIIAEEVDAQNTFPSSGNVGIGTTSPGDHLHVLSASTNGGITVTQTYGGSASLNLINNTSGGRRYVVGSTGIWNSQGSGHFNIYDYTAATDRLILKSGTGYLGINTANPSTIGHFVTNSSTDDGLTLEQAGSGNSGIYFNRTGGGAVINWSILTAQTSFKIKTNYGTLFDMDNNGNVGLSTPVGSYRMEIKTKAGSGLDDGLKITGPSGSGAVSLYLNNNNAAKNWAMKASNGGEFSVSEVNGALDALKIQSNGKTTINGTSWSSGPDQLFVNSTQDRGLHTHVQKSGNLMGVWGQVNNTSPSTGYSYGVYGSATDGLETVGGKFVAWSHANCPQGTQSIGVYGAVINPCSSDWAGYFEGNVNVTGSLLVNSTWYSSDRKLKRDIRPLSGAMEKLARLKPSSYLFRTDEYQTLQLPEVQQVGLIAQEVEEIFPEFVSEKPEGNMFSPEGEKITYPAHKVVNYTALIPVLVAGMQEQQTQIARQQALIDKQQQLLDELAARVNVSSGIEETRAADEITSLLLSDKRTVIINQNVPNPFAESTVITYSIPEGFQKAQLIFRTSDGAVIKTADITRAGKGSFTVFADDLSNGSYSYSLVVDGAVVDSKTMIKQ